MTALFKKKLRKTKKKKEKVLKSNCELKGNDFQGTADQKH